MLSRQRQTLFYASTLAASCLSLRNRRFPHKKNVNILETNNTIKKYLPIVNPAIPHVKAYGEELVNYLHKLNKDLGLVAPGRPKSVLIDDLDYLVEYSKPYKLPLYTIEVLDLCDISDRENCCYSNWVATEFSANDLDYFVVASWSDYLLSRGRLAAECNHLRSERTFRETSNYLNAVPLHYKLNDGAWGYLENYVRSIIKHRSPKKVCVISGPIIPKDPKYLGVCNQIAIPGAFFKIIVEELQSDGKDKKGPQYNLYSFILPNIDTDQLPDRFEDIELHLQQFLAPISIIEELTELRFFPDLSTERVLSHIENLYQDREEALEILGE